MGLLYLLSVCPGKCQDVTSDTDCHRFLLRPLQFVMHHHSTALRYTAWCTHSVAKWTKKKCISKNPQKCDTGYLVNLLFGLDERGNLGSISPQQRLDRLCGKPGRFHSLLVGGRCLSEWWSGFGLELCLSVVMVKVKPYPRTVHEGTEGE